MYGHIRCIYTVLANPTDTVARPVLHPPCEQRSLWCPGTVRPHCADGGAVPYGVMWCPGTVRPHCADGDAVPYGVISCAGACSP